MPRDGDEVVRKVHAGDGASAPCLHERARRRERRRADAAADVNAAHRRIPHQVLQREVVELGVERVERLLGRHGREVVQVHQEVRRRRVERGHPLSVAPVVGVDGALVAGLVIGGHGDALPDGGALGLPDGRSTALQACRIGAPLDALLLREVAVAIEDARALGRQRRGLGGEGSLGKRHQRADLQQLQRCGVELAQELAVVLPHRALLAEVVEDRLPVRLVREGLLHLPLRLGLRVCARLRRRGGQQRGRRRLLPLRRAVLGPTAEGADALAHGAAGYERRGLASVRALQGLLPSCLDCQMP
mmetsp:Transcript_94083/g.243016  ORF Transcript_94083/g.243016 Transcript_94083/m.243016 type:complete len:303 (+) Transcript_94083:2461-3369(+)